VDVGFVLPAIADSCVVAMAIVLVL